MVQLLIVRRCVALLLMFYLLLSALRIALIVTYPQLIAYHNWQSIVTALWQGAWYFDSSIIAVMTAIPLLALLLPLRFAITRWWQWVWGWSLFVLWVLVACAGISDLVYFGYVDRHIGSEVAVLSADWPLMMTLFLSYGWWFALFIVACVPFAWYWFRILRTPLSMPQGCWRLFRWCVLPVLFVLFALMIRGGIHDKPISPVDAFADGDISLGHVRMNAAFSIAHQLRGNTIIPMTVMDEQAALQQVWAYLADRDHIRIQHNVTYPFIADMHFDMRSLPAKRVVLLVLESWDVGAIDTYRRLDGLPSLGMTPNFDALAMQGRLYTNFFAAGTRSIDAMQAILTGLPRLPGWDMLGEGVEHNRFSWLGHLFRTNMHTYFWQASRRHSFHLNDITALAGFADYAGAEDLLPSIHPNSPPPHWGGWDMDMFASMHRQLTDTDRPLLTMGFSATTHAPYDVPSAEWHVLPNNSAYNHYLNTLHYADWALGQWLTSAKEAGYFDETIWLITADHASGLSPRAAGDIRAQYRVPLLIIAPGVSPGVDSRLGSHIDIAPTIAALTGVVGQYAGIGRSLLHDKPPAWVPAFADTLLYAIADDDTVAYIPGQLDDSVSATDKVGAMRRQLAALAQVQQQALLHNRLFHD